MAEILRYVDPNSTAGGDGTAQTLSGATRAYVSLNAWEAATQQDLVTGGNTARVVCSSNLDAGGGAEDTTVATIDGWTTGAANGITIVANSSHGGKWNTGKYRIVITNSRAIDIVEDFVDISGLQVSISASNTNNCDGIRVRGADGCRNTISKCIIKGGHTGTSASAYGVLISWSAAGTSRVCNIHNCIIYDFVNGAINTVGGVQVNQGWTLNTRNVTVHNSYFGISRLAGTANATNCGAASCTTGFSGTITQTTCSTTTPTFVDEAGDDFHLASGDTTWKDAGTDLSGTFTDDIDGVTRTGTWDIGADEYVAAGGGSAIPVFMNQYRQRWR